MNNLIPQPNELNPADQFSDEVKYSSYIEEGWKTSFNVEIVHNGCNIMVAVDYFEQEYVYTMVNGTKYTLEIENELSHIPIIRMLIGNDKTQIRYSALNFSTREFINEACEYHMMNNQTFYKEEKEV